MNSKYAEKWLLAGVLVVFAVGLASSGCNEQTAALPEGKALTSSSAETLSASLEAATEDVLSKLPIWTEQVNEVTAQISGNNDAGWRLKEPNTIIELYDDNSFSFDGIRPDGAIAYSTEDKTAVFKHNVATGYWKYIREPQMEELQAESVISDEQAEVLADAIFEELGLPVSERGEVQSFGIARSDGEKHWLAARQVRIKRVVNGLRVIDSHLMATFTPTGTLQRLEVRWPEFKLHTNKAVYDKDEVAQDIAFFYMNDGLGAEEMSNLVTDIVYWYSREQQLFEPMLLLYMKEGDNSYNPASQRYSLVSGLVEREAVSESGDF